MGNIVVRLYLLLLHSMASEYQEIQAPCEAPGICTNVRISSLEAVQGPLTLIVAGPLELQEYVLLAKRKKH